MKHLNIWIIITIALVISPYVAHKIHAGCNNENRQHVRRHATNCTYSQKDLKRILKDNNERYGKNCEEHTCFYCSCPIEDHSGQ